MVKDHQKSASCNAVYSIGKVSHHLQPTCGTLRCMYQIRDLRGVTYTDSLLTLVLVLYYPYAPLEPFTLQARIP